MGISGVVVKCAVRTGCALALAALLVSPLSGYAQTADQELKWPALKRALFGDREVTEDNTGDVVYLSVRNHPDNASVVPVLIQARIDQTPERYIKRVYLVIDENPSPFGVRFTLTPESGRADVETRVRMESSSPVRAIAELNDGSLWMQSTMVYAAGGCTAAFSIGRGEEGVGEMRLNVDSDSAGKGQPVRARLLVQHPQFSGMASNAIVPPHFVRQVNVYYADRLVMSADLDFTISQNPSFRFYFLPGPDGALRAEVVDSTELRFEQTIAVPAPR
jgi:sulfur-oxidizing protein SoxY